MYQAIQRILRENLQYRDGERVLVLTDPEMCGCAGALAQSLREAGARPRLLSVDPAEFSAREPDPLVLSALQNTHVAFLVTRRSIAHSRTVLDLLHNRAIRIADASGIHFDQLVRLLDAPPGLSDELFQFLRRGGTLRLRSVMGTDLELQIDTVHRDTAFPGTFLELPPGEVYVLPKVSSVNGLLVVDSSASELGRVEEPVKILIREGLVKQMSDPRLAPNLDPSMLCLTKLGFGTNRAAGKTGNPFEERKAEGVMSLGFGSNELYGGAFRAPFHFWVCLSSATIELNGETLPETFLAAGETRAIAPPPFVAMPEAYKILFENSNDAQYILDFESQLFLKVNPAFEKLTGYSAAEVEGKMRSSELVAPESRDVHARRRQTRRSVPAERYEIKMQMKDRTVRPIEVSVRLVSIGDREVIVGSLRDMSEHKKLTEAAWEKVEQVIRANSRLGMIKEKLEQMQNLARELFNIRVEDEVYEFAAEFMRDRAHLGYEQVTFWRLQGDALEVVYTTSKTRKAKIPADSDTPLIKVLKGEEPPILEPGRLVLPLKGIESNLGIVELHIPPKEWDTMNGSPAAIRSYQNIALALSNLLGLAIENIRLYERVFQQSIIDSLTGCYNRRYFDTKLEEEIKRCARYKRPLSLLMIDINGFKEINDTMGHRQGDVVLQEVGQVLRRSTREVDIVARYGGDEFTIILPETSRENALVKAGSLSRIIAEQEFTNIYDPHKKIRLTASIGVASFEGEEVKQADDLLRIADESMYRQKAEHARSRK